MRYDVRVCHGPYESVVSVNASDGEEAIAKAKYQTRQYRTLPMAYENFEIVRARGATLTDNGEGQRDG